MPADVITDGGRAQAAGYFSLTVTPPANYFGNIGTGAGIANRVDTALFAEVGTARIATTNSRVTTTVTNDTSQHSFTYTATGPLSATNAGYFTASTGGTLIQKSDFSAVPIAATDSMAFNFKNQAQ